MAKVAVCWTKSAKTLKLTDNNGKKTSREVGVPCGKRLRADGTCPTHGSNTSQSRPKALEA